MSLMSRVATFWVNQLQEDEAKHATVILMMKGGGKEADRAKREATEL